MQQSVTSNSYASCFVTKHFTAIADVATFENSTENLQLGSLSEYVKFLRMQPVYNYWVESDVYLS